jgi:CheY-like chemotaxis protein
VRDESGAVVRVLGGAIDITDRRRIEAERVELLDAERAARAEAEAASRAKDDFLATLSHELRTPLSAILIWSRLIASPSVNAADTAEGLDAIVRSAEAQKRLIDDLLDSARIASGKLRLDLVATEIRSLVADAVEAVRPTAEAKGITVATDLAADAGVVMVDPGRVRQIVWNLLNNAVKFTGAGGRIDVGLWRADGHLGVRIADTGRGIDAAFLPHVFERFKQAEVGATRTAGGLGLGLAIVKQLVEMHNGRIEAASDGPGRGATFTVELPLPTLALTRRARAATKRGVPATGNIRSLAGLQVMIVEDQPDTRRATRMLLEAAEATVVEAATAGDAEALYATLRPDLLISDIGLPDADGRALLARLRAADAARPPVPAIALTAFAHDSERAQTLAAGFDAIVVKPFHPEALLIAIADALPAVDE